MSVEPLDQRMDMPMFQSMVQLYCFPLCMLGLYKSPADPAAAALAMTFMTDIDAWQI